ncbi:MAG: hypothetical protein QOJ19_71 [Acidimicrobiia bacterium]|nr:hypothetical protein [Acidimicrobiia bacterium]
MSHQLFRDRGDAGRALTGLLAHYESRPDVVVVGLPPGGMSVAYELATTLSVPLDVAVVRKLPVPGDDRLSLGAICSGGVVVLDDDLVRGFGLEADHIERIVQTEGRLLGAEESALRHLRPPLPVEQRDVIVVDDGLSTGTALRATLVAMRRRHPRSVVVALPIASASARQELAIIADEVVCAITPDTVSVSEDVYASGGLPSTQDVAEMLQAAAESLKRQAGARPHRPADVIRADAIRLHRESPSDEVLLDLVGDARVVMLGTASHGTHDFSVGRADMTQRLIEQRGFGAVVVEGDWPDAYRVNRYVRGRSSPSSGDATAEEALQNFQAFPSWRWRNAVVLDFVGWLREHNDRIGGDDEPAKAGFYGLDLYSLHRSIQEVIAYLASIDPAAAERARQRYSCFEQQGGDDGRAYGFAAAFGAGESCETQVVDQLVELKRIADEYASRHGLLAEDEAFYAEQNAHLVVDAEAFYRTMFRGRVSSWNLREQHMADTLDALLRHLGRRRGEPARIVVWTHNSHAGDARATETGLRGELSLGQLVRQRHPGASWSVAFTTYTGTVTAASDWGAPVDRKHVRPALPGSVEQVLHETALARLLLPFATAPRSADVLRETRLERSIGVIYRPRTERESHYFRARVADQFDALIHLDETRAVEPLERTSRWEGAEVPETYPTEV